MDHRVHDLMDLLHELAGVEHGGNIRNAEAAIENCTIEVHARDGDSMKTTNLLHTYTNQSVKIVFNAKQGSIGEISIEWSSGHETFLVGKDNLEMDPRFLSFGNGNKVIVVKY